MREYNKPEAKKFFLRLVPATAEEVDQAAEHFKNTLNALLNGVEMPHRPYAGNKRGVELDIGTQAVRVVQDTKSPRFTILVGGEQKADLTYDRGEGIFVDSDGKDGLVAIGVLLLSLAAK